MRKIFWENPYQTELQTRVIEVRENEVLFESTIAYSFSGGQESDQASVNGKPVLNSRMAGNLIYYQFSENHGFQVNDQVVMKIDWTRRFRLMRLHFAAELVLEIVTQKHQLEKVGAHISEHKARIDFISHENISGKFDEILKQYNQIIERKLPIQKDFSDESTQRRYWKIEGFAEVPCGGTHVNTTEEVGFITLKRAHPGKSIERIEIQLR